MAQSKGKTATQLLKGMKNGWKKAAAEKGGFTPIEFGTWACRLDKGFMDCDKSGELQIVWDLKVLNGPSKGKTCKKWSSMKTEQNLGWLKGELETLDVEIPDDITELPELLETLTGTFVEVTFKPNGEFTNIYFNEVINEDDLEIEEDGEEDSTDDVESDEPNEDEDGDTSTDDDDDEESEDDDEEEEEEEEEEDGTIDISKMKKPELLEICEANGWKPSKTKVIAEGVARIRKYVQKKFDALEEE